jgi:hypothetical protein
MSKRVALGGPAVAAVVSTLGLAGVAAAQSDTDRPAPAPVDADPGLRIYATPPGKLLYSLHNDDFTVRVRKPGSAWRDLYEYNVKVDLDKPQDASVVQFDFDGEVEVAVQKDNGLFRQVDIRPTRDAIKPTVKGAVVYFKLDAPRNLSVEFDGDRLHNLHILAGALDTPAAPGPNVTVYGPGLHVPPDGGLYFPVASNQTIYIAGGAVMRGTFRPTEVKNVRIVGRGLIVEPAEQFVVHKSSNVLVEGLTFLSPLHGTIACSGSSHVQFRDLKTFSAGQWSDGINIFACQDVEIDRAFIRTSDDSVAVYATRKDGVGDTRRVKVTRSVFWPDVAHAMFVGLHGDSVTPNTLEDIAFDDIDVLNLDEDDPEYQGVMAISAGDSNTVRDVSFSDIRIEHVEEGKLINLRVVYNAKYNTSPGLAIDGVTFRNISYSGSGWAGPSIIAGLARDRRVRNVSFDNVTIAGRKLTAPSPGVLEVGPFVDGVTFK